MRWSARWISSVEAPLQLSVQSYATAMNGLAGQEDLRLRFDVLDQDEAA